MRPSGRIPQRPGPSSRWASTTLGLFLAACGAMSTDLPGLRGPSARVEKRRGVDFERPPLPSWEEHPILGLDLEEHCYDLQFDEFAACDQGGACRLSVVSELDWGNPGENYDAQ